MLKTLMLKRSIDLKRAELENSANETPSSRPAKRNWNRLLPRRRPRTSSPP